MSATTSTLPASSGVCNPLLLPIQTVTSMPNANTEYWSAEVMYARLEVDSKPVVECLHLGMHTCTHTRTDGRTTRTHNVSGPIYMYRREIIGSFRSRVLLIRTCRACWWGRRRCVQAVVVRRDQSQRWRLTADRRLSQTAAPASHSSPVPCCHAPSRTHCTALHALIAMLVLNCTVSSTSYQIYCKHAVSNQQCNSVVRIE